MAADLCRTKDQLIVDTRKIPDKQSCAIEQEMPFQD
jgi:hypothetical protein